MHRGAFKNHDTAPLRAKEAVRVSQFESLKVFVIPFTWASCSSKRNLPRHCLSCGFYRCNGFLGFVTFRLVLIFAESFHCALYRIFFHNSRLCLDCSFPFSLLASLQVFLDFFYTCTMPFVSPSHLFPIFVYLIPSLRSFSRIFDLSLSYVRTELPSHRASIASAV